MSERKVYFGNKFVLQKLPPKGISCFVYLILAKQLVCAASERCSVFGIDVSRDSREFFFFIERTKTKALHLHLLGALTQQHKLLIK